ncbi:MAG: gliding motility-associated C-terminal domain-containing protein [Flavisolibacter sp.]
MSTTNKLHTAVSCKHLFTLLTLCMWAAVGFSQTDQCANAGDLPILFNGFMTGTLSPTAPADFSLATVEPGESFSPAVTAAGQTQKSVWYRFTLPTTRSVSIVLGQYGALMAPGDLGLTVYKTSSCLPADSLVSTRLSPLTDFDTTSSSCVEAGTYLVQVSGKASANGLAYIQLILGQPAAAYDLTTQAYNFGTLTNGTQSVDYAVDCQSTEDITEFCTSLSNPGAYNKSSWQVFTTPSSFERIVFSLTPQTAPPGQVFGYRLYRGDVRISAVTVVTACDSLTTGANDTASRSYTCGQLRGSTVYSVELFFRQDFRDNIHVSLTTTTPLVQNSNITTCGSSYQLPWGQLVSTSGSYSDTIRAMAGCDSLIRNVQLLFANGSTAVAVQQFKDTICQGGSFALPWGPLVSTGGLYADTLRYLSGCDSVIRLEDLYIRTWNRDTVAVSLCGNQSYTLPGGTTVNSPGFYPDTLHYQNSSCDSLIRIFQISVALDSSTRDTVTLCSGTPYTLPWGPVITAPGIYKDTATSLLGCDSLIRSITILVNEPLVKNILASICPGQSYTFPSGRLVSLPGTYQDTVRALRGCDSLITNLDLRLQSTLTSDTLVRICEGQTYTLPWGTVVSMDSVYRDTVRTAAGCDSLVRSVTISLSRVTLTLDTVLSCSGPPYTLPWGTIVNSSGSYRDTLRNTRGCDSLIRTVDLQLNTPLVNHISAATCPGQPYTLPSGRVVSLPGAYQDTLRALGGCDSLITVLDLSIISAGKKDTTVTICAGQSYTLPWGPLVNTDSVYRDTLRTASGCDSLVRSVTLRVYTLKVTSDTVINCSGMPFTLPWGMVVSTGGTFSDTTRSLGGCDSLIQHITVRINTPLMKDVSASICASQSYTLPSGRVVSLPGQYQDTVRALAGCDSLVTRLDLSLITSLRRDTTVTICEGASYALPWGPVVTAEGQYKDTIRTTTGCDSLLLSLDLKIQKVTVTRDTVTVCAGQPYALPWGQMVTAPGTYRDTLRYASGCDSLVRTLTLALTVSFTDSASASFCTGSSYTLPWGMTVTTAGQYWDTIRTLAGCDSLIRLVDLRENGLTTLTDTASLCSRGNYTLPWGTVVTVPGLYTDTLKHQSGGCDSLVRRLVLLSNTPLYRDTAAFFCAGSTYTLPWGVAVATAGVYGDTLRYAAGCDSLIRSVHLRELAPAFRSLDTSICSGQVYTLPSGKTIQTAGIYQDTIPSSMGCDSLIWQVRLSIHSPVTISIDTLIYAGQNYTLPWGEVVNAAGVYTDTLPYTSGCDSLISIIHLAVNAVRWQTTAATICQGSGYTLPWGPVVFSAGPYRDTLRSAGGRDSLIREVVLSVQTPQTLPQSLSVCGGSYRLPWGQIVYNSGSYSDTLASTAGCDSLIRIIDLRMVSPVRETLPATICQGQSFTLPWGKVVTAGGLYADTLRSGAGCDSLIRSVDLTLHPAPLVRISKSNDINCQLGSATLSASGGGRYSWSPGTSLSDTTVYNPVATPNVSTLYRVRVSGPNGCETEDSIWVAVNIADPEKGFLVPNAFTPDHDGLNDCFGIRHWGAVTDLHFSIYNRWGQLIFQTSNPADCWDGTYRNARLPSGTFVYLIRANTLCGRVERKGTVTLIR